MATPSNNMASSAAGNMAAGGAMAAVSGIMGSVKEKWDSSGGNEVLSNVTQQLPQGTKEYIAQAKSKFFDPSNLRSAKVFFGFGEEKPFYLEKTPPLLVERVKHNMTFFYMNYMLMTAVLFVLTLVVSPMAIVGLALLAFAWVGVIRATSNGSTTVKGVTITQKQASIGMTILSVIFLFYILRSVFWWTLSIAGFFTAAHGVLRDASMHKDEEDKVEMSGDLSLGEDASFLNPADVEKGSTQ